MLSCSQYNTYASYKFDTVYYLQHLHYLQYNTYRYLQYDTYTSYNTIFVLLTVKNIFFNLQYVYNFVVLIQYTAVYIYIYIYINIFFIVLLLIIITIITEKVHIIYAYRIIAGRNDKEKKKKKGN